MLPFERFLAGGIAALILAVAASPAQAQSTYPDRPVKILVPFAVGGLADLLARTLAQKISEQTGKSVVVDNKTGAGGLIGYEAGAKPPADGYTDVATDVTYTMMPALYKKLPWNPQTEQLAPVAMIGSVPFAIVVRKDAGVNNLAEWIAKAKGTSAKLNYGSAGVGSVNHVVTELFSGIAGIQMVNVPYRGMGEAITGMLNNSVDVLITALPTAVGQVRNGNVRALAVTAAKRSSVLTDVPATTEAGTRFVASNWIGLTAPANTPAAVVNWMAKAMSAAIASNEVKQTYQRQGAEISDEDDPVKFGRFMNAEQQRWAEVIRTAKISADQ